MNYAVEITFECEAETPQGIDTLSSTYATIVNTVHGDIAYKKALDLALEQFFKPDTVPCVTTISVKPVDGEIT